MKIATTILTVLLVITLAGGAYFFLSVHQPMAVDYEKLQQGQPEFDKVRKDLAKIKDMEKQESAWMGPAADALKKGLASDISAGKAEVATAGNRVIVNIAEGVLYTPLSVTFARDSKPALDNLAALLKALKDKEIFVGNMTQAAPAQGKGRKRVPAKDARTLAAARSAELVKYLEKNGVPADTLIAVSYPARQPERGFKIKDKKTVIVISAPSMPAAEASASKQETKPAAKPAPATQGTATNQATKPATSSQAAPTTPAGSAASQPKSFPISTVPPKKAQ
jgi:outer membrane protein OmpA-like peptidoglycan-associated protein